LFRIKYWGRAKYYSKVMVVEARFEVVETYLLDGRRRFRLRLEGTNIIVNVEADDEEEAARKAAALLEKSGILRMLKSRR